MGKFKDYWEKLELLVRAHPKGKPYDAKGFFYPDPTPVAPPPGQSHVADIDMFEVMKQRLRSEGLIRQQMEDDEDIDEANDFEVDDETEPFSPYEEIVEQYMPDGPLFRPNYEEVNAALEREHQANQTLERRETASKKNAPADGPAAPKPAAKPPEGLPEASKSGTV